MTSAQQITEAERLLNGPVTSGTWPYLWRQKGDAQRFWPNIGADAAKWCAGCPS